MRGTLKSRLKALELTKFNKYQVTQNQIDEVAAIIDEIRQKPGRAPAELADQWKALEIEAYKKYGGNGGIIVRLKV